MWLMKRVLAVLLPVVALSGCMTADPTAAGSSSPPTNPSNPVIETFTGTVQPQGHDVHPFTITLSGGTLAVTLTSVAPNIAMGLSVGTWDGATCTTLQNGTTIATAGTAPQLSGQVNLGSYCVIVADALTGAQTGPVTYSLTVSHY